MHLRKSEIMDVDFLSELVYCSEKSLGFDENYMSIFKDKYNVNKDFIEDNFSYCMLDNDIIVGFFWLDADDVILEKDKIKLLNLKENFVNNIDMVIMKYDVAFDKNDNAIFSYSRERIFKRKMEYNWIGEVHEVIEHFGNIVYSDIAITHKKIKQNDPQRNLKIFENMLSNGKLLDTRQKYYCARELYFNNRLGNIKRACEYNEKAGKTKPLDENYLYNKIYFDNLSKQNN